MIILPDFYPKWYVSVYVEFEKHFQNEVKCLSSTESRIPFDEIEYGLFEGRRTRAVLYLSVKQNFGLDSEDFQYATSIEFFHRASLLFDDIFDGELQRRGKNTYCVEYGKKKAIILALYYLSEGLKRVAHLSTSIYQLWTTSFQKIIEGEYIDITNDGKITKDYAKTSFFFKHIGDIIDCKLNKCEYSLLFETIGTAFQKCNDYFDKDNGAEIRNTLQPYLLRSDLKGIDIELEKEYNIIQDSKIPNNLKKRFKEFIKLFTFKDYWYHEYK